MKTKIINLWAFIVLTCLSLQAQILSPSVIATGGGYTAQDIGSLSYTIGEMTMIETFTQESLILTQGFQQPEINTVFTNELESSIRKILLYPNPTSGEIRLSFHSENMTQNTVQIYNLLGSEIFNETFTTQSGLSNLTIDLSKYNQGIYFLELVTELHGRKIVNVKKITLIN